MRCVHNLFKDMFTLKRLFIVGCILGCVIVAWVAYRALVGSGVDESLPEGVQRIADVTLPDAHGKPLTLSGIQAPVRVVHFWASWNPYSKDDLPALVALKQQFGKDIEVLAINRDTNPLEGQAFLGTLGLADSLLFVYDRADTYYKEVGGYNMPETVFVGSAGEIHAHMRGPVGYDVMASAVRDMLRQEQEQ